MANDGNKPGFDPHSMPTIIEQRPFAGAEQPPPAYAPPAAPAEPATPKGVGQLLGEAFDLYKKNFVALLLVALVGMGPVAFVTSGLTAALSGVGTVGGASMKVDTDRINALNDEMREAVEKNDQARMREIAHEQQEIAMNALGKGAGMLATIGAMILGLLLMVPLTVVAYTLTQAALTAMAVDRAREGTLSWSGAWGAVFQRFGALLGTSILLAIGTLVGLAMCFLPGLVFAFISCFAILVVFLEKRSGVDAIKRSFEAVKADLGRTILVLLAFGAISFVAHAVLGLFIPNRFVFLDTFVSQLGSILIAPFGLIGLTLLFQDIRRTKLNVTDAEIAEQESELLPTV